MNEARSPVLIREHYEIEKALARKLCLASREERRRLYTELYDELFRRVPDHPQLTRKSDDASSAQEAARKMQLVRRYLQPDSVLLEIGAGDCRFSFEAARHVRQVYAVDVSAEIAKHGTAPRNFTLVLSDGCTVPVPDGSVTVAYSNQLMEHLHPDDALAQLNNIHRALQPGGWYICITPNRYSGPHDVSQYFDDVATGFHLKEYSYGELARVFRDAGFRSLRAYIGGKGVYLRFPLMGLLWLERLLDALPQAWRQRLARSFPGRALLGANLLGRKPRRDRP